MSKLKGYTGAEILSPKEVLGNNILKDHKVMSDQDPAVKQLKVMATRG